MRLEELSGQSQIGRRREGTSDTVAPTNLNTLTAGTLFVHDSSSQDCQRTKRPRVLNQTKCSFQQSLDYPQDEFKEGEAALSQ